LKKLAEVKKVNKNPNKYAIYNRKVVIKNFDEQIILRKILEMFEHIQRK